MPRPRKPPRLIERTEFNRTTGERQLAWVIRDGDRYIRVGYGRGDRDHAEAEFAAYLATRVAEGQGYTDPAKLTVGAVLSKYGLEKGTQAADPARIGYAIQALTPYWGDRTVAQVRTASCQDYARTRRRAGIADSTIRRELGTLSTALRHAQKEGLIAIAPGVALPRKAERRERWLTRSEVAILLAIARANRRQRHVARFIVLSLYTGTRSKATLALRTHQHRSAGHIDLETGILYRRGGEERVTAKRRNPARLSRKALAHARRFARAAQGGLFIHYGGKPVAKLRSSWRAIIAEAARRRPDIDWSEVTPHTLKHTAITWAMQKGMTKEDAASYFSTTVQVIEDHYWHHSPDFHGRQTDIIDRRD